jgi:hypothetical protein
MNHLLKHTSTMCNDADIWALVVLFKSIVLNDYVVIMKYTGCLS